jgi:hypothetical protein
MSALDQCRSEPLAALVRVRRDGENVAFPGNGLRHDEGHEVPAQFHTQCQDGRIQQQAAERHRAPRIVEAAHVQLAHAPRIVGAQDEHGMGHLRGSGRVASGSRA